MKKALQQSRGKASRSTTCSRRRLRLTTGQVSLLKTCNQNPSKRMWVWKTRPEYYRAAMALLRRGLIEQDGDPETFRMTKEGVTVANAPAQAAPHPTENDD